MLMLIWVNSPMLMEQNIKLVKFYSTLLLNTPFKEKNSMLNYKLSINVSKDNLN